MSCEDPWHDNNSISFNIYDECPSCGANYIIKIKELEAELVVAKIYLKDLNEEIDQFQKENAALKEKLNLLRRYHGGDGSITREQIITSLGEDSGA